MKSYKKDFRMLDDGTIYLDTAATSLKPESVVNALSDYYLKYGVNVNRGVYEKAYITTTKYEESRNKIAEFINCKPKEIIFTRGASSALNLVALSYAQNNLKKGDEILVSELEHHSNLLPWYNVAKKTGAIVKFVDLVNNKITLEGVKKSFTSNTKLVALTMMSNVLGYLTPIKEIVDFVHSKNAVIVVDAAQAIAHTKVDVQDIGCDFLAFSGHKIFAPTGVGVLFGKTELLKSMEPVEYGGDMIDKVTLEDMEPKDIPHKFETGTMPISSIIAFKEAIDYLESIGYEYIEKYELYLTEYLRKELSKIEEIEVYNNVENTVLCFNIKDVHPHDAASFFDKNKICLRAGHHCAQLVSQRLGVTSTLRASFYIHNDYNDIDIFVKTIKEVIEFFKQF